MRLFSLEGKLAILLAALSVAGTAFTILLGMLWSSPWLVATVASLVLVPVSIWVARQIASPLASILRVVSGSVTSFRDGDFSTSLNATRNDELGDLLRAHNELGRVLRDERQNLFQRELLLDTVVQNGGKRMNGLDFGDVVAECPQPLAAALASHQDRLFTVNLDNEDETFHLSQRDVRLNGRSHRLLQIKRLTRELSRQEVQTWKKVIRVISHELNNSLAPISSLAHSGRALAQRGDNERLTTVFDTIEERSRHLDGFIRGYAEFAKLPQPRREDVDWSEFLNQLGQHHAFRLAGSAPTQPGKFDRAQLEQVMINLLKNAHEAGDEGGSVEIAVLPRGNEVRIEVRDRGTGMSETVLANALLPFYSTKRSGTGLGLALTREIVEAHGGRVTLANREGGGLVVALALPQD